MSQELNSIKARLGSLSSQSILKLPKAVQTLLVEDMPRLIAVAECVKSDPLIIPAELGDELFI